MSVTAGTLPVAIPSVLFNRHLAAANFLLAFDEPRLAELVRPGHFLMVTLPGLHDPLLPRPFAVYNVEGSRIEILCKKIGKGTALLSLLRTGDPLQILGPLGNGFRIPEPPAFCLLLAGGIGIASLHLLAKHSLRRGLPTVLLYGAKSGREIVPMEELESMGLELRIAVEDGTRGFQGLVTDLFLRFVKDMRGLSPIHTTTFVCGPPAMLRQVAGILKAKGMDAQFSLEARMACGYGVCQGCVTRALDPAHPQGWQYRKVCTEGPVFGLNEIDWQAIE